ncbi:MAG: sialate O-acetylesterase [Cytophagaceae bacterium]|nr:sialate O-acetylesterase [Cytophagaceae bacterium]
MKIRHYLLVLLGCVCFASAKAQLKLPIIFNDNMVLQRNSEVPVWGWATPGEQVNITATWTTGNAYTAAADEDGKWMVRIPTTEGPGPYEMIIKDSQSPADTLSNVMLGEVWLASGQSNMEWSAGAGIKGGEPEIKRATNPQIRFFKVPHLTADEEQQDTQGVWQESIPETMKEFSAVAYFFAKKINEQLGVPVGVIGSYWGGSPAEIWIPQSSFIKDTLLTESASKIKEQPWSPIKPSVAYNAMVAPLVPYDIAGVLWYQGETNAQNVEYYEHTFTSLINSWRKKWDKDFPFYYAQIAPYNYEEGNDGVGIRDVQRRVLHLPATGMVMTSDIGNINDIHHRNKIDVGERFANLALAKYYKTLDQTVEGPLPIEAKYTAKGLEVHFKNNKDLQVRGPMRSMQFEVAGEDMVFKTAMARVEDDIVVLQSPVATPKYVRYAWKNTAEPDIFNAAGLPLTSFMIGVEKK